MLTIGRDDRLSMALELAKHNPVYEDIASKFFEVGRAFSFSFLVQKTWTGLTGYSPSALHLHRRRYDLLSRH